MRYSVLGILLLMTASARADLIETIHIGDFGSAAVFANGDFENPVDLSGWTNSGLWTLEDPPVTLAVSGRHAAASVAGTTALLSRTFTIPTLVTTAALTWSHDLDPGVSNWADSSHEYRVYLSRVGNPANFVEVFTSNIQSGNQLAISNANNVAGAASAGTAATFQDWILANLGASVSLNFEVLESSATSIAAYVDNVFLSTTYDTDSVPEPSSFLLAGLPAIGLWVRRRRQRNKAACPVA